MLMGSNTGVVGMPIMTTSGNSILVVALALGGAGAGASGRTEQLVRAKLRLAVHKARGRAGLSLERSSGKNMRVSRIRWKDKTNLRVQNRNSKRNIRLF
jgi:hypothetical protein